MLNEGRLPPSIADLYKQGLVTDLEVFVAPMSGTAIAQEAETESKTGYEMLSQLSAQRPLLLFREKAGLYPGKPLAIYSDRRIREAEGQETVRTERRTVPDVIGLSAAAARKKLLDAGCAKVEFVAADEPSPSADRQFSVKSQEPPAGSKVDAARSIRVIVYPGRRRMWPAFSFRTWRC